MVYLLKIAGGLMILLALIHLAFPRYFRWKEEFATVSLINKEMMYVHTFFIALVVLLMGLMCVFCAEDLAGTQLGHRIALGCGLFWSVRLVIQFFGYSSAHWKGKRFETGVHVLFTALWGYLTAVFLAVA